MKRDMRKSLWSLILAVALLVTALPVPVSAALTAGEVKAKQQIITGIQNHAGTIKVSAEGVDYERAANLYLMAIFERPDFFYCSSTVRASYDSVSVYVYPYYNGYYSSACINAFNTRTSQVLAACQVAGRPDLTVQNIYNWMIANCAYDNTHSKRTAYDCLVGGSSVCQGYSLAFQHLMNRAGIPCTIIISRKLNHSWNMVTLGGRNYYIDATSHIYLCDEATLRKKYIEGKLANASDAYDWVNVQGDHVGAGTVSSLNVSSVTLKKGQSTTAVRLVGSDTISSIRVADKKVAKVTNKGTALYIKGLKKGSTSVVVYFTNGGQKTLKIKVQTKAVACSSLSLSQSKVTLKKGQSFTLGRTVSPITCVQKTTYTSSKKKVATVSKKGVVKAKKAGTAKITVKVGSKKKTCTVKVVN